MSMDRIPAMDGASPIVVHIPDDLRSIGDFNADGFEDFVADFSSVAYVLL
ncbi:MAG: hypothetical protein U0930_11185 [Pirellulales bacterium]